MKGKTVSLEKKEERNQTRSSTRGKSTIAHFRNVVILVMNDDQMGRRLRKSQRWTRGKKRGEEMFLSLPENGGSCCGDEKKRNQPIIPLQKGRWVVTFYEGGTTAWGEKTGERPPPREAEKKGRTAIRHKEDHQQQKEDRLYGFLEGGEGFVRGFGREGGESLWGKSKGAPAVGATKTRSDTRKPLS